MKSRHCVGAIFTLDDGFPVQRVPVIKLSVELDGDDVQVARIMVPGEIAVYTDYIHVGSLGKQNRGVVLHFTREKCKSPPFEQAADKQWPHLSTSSQLLTFLTAQECQKVQLCQKFGSIWAAGHESKINISAKYFEVTKGETSEFLFVLEQKVQLSHGAELPTISQQGSSELLLQRHLMAPSSHGTKVSVKEHIHSHTYIK